MAVITGFASAIIGGSFRGAGSETIFIHNLEGCFYGNVHHEGIVRDRYHPERCSDDPQEQELRANPEKDPGTGMTGEELWQRGKQPKNLVATIITGL